MQFNDGIDDDRVMVRVSLADLMRLRRERAEALLSYDVLKSSHDKLLIDFRGVAYATADLLKALRPEDDRAPDIEEVVICADALDAAVTWGSSKEDVEARDKAVSERNAAGGA